LIKEILYKKLLGDKAKLFGLSFNSLTHYILLKRLTDGDSPQPSLPSSKLGFFILGKSILGQELFASNSSIQDSTKSG
jgi:hypothetical protein